MPKNHTKISNNIQDLWQCFTHLKTTFRTTKILNMNVLDGSTNFTKLPVVSKGGVNFILNRTHCMIWFFLNPDWFIGRLYSEYLWSKIGVILALVHILFKNYICIVQGSTQYHRKRERWQMGWWNNMANAQVCNYPIYTNIMTPTWVQIFQL